MKIRYRPDNSACLKYKDLTPGKIYTVIGIEADDYRILSDQRRPYLYPPDIFEIVSEEEPSDWISKYGEEGESYAYPKELNESGFFEDYFGGDSRAKMVLQAYLTKMQIAQS